MYVIWCTCSVILQQEIIEQLIENSTTFKGKTEYAQEKWVKKKKQKYVFSDKEIKIKDLHHVYKVKEISSLGARSIHLRNNVIIFSAGLSSLRFYLF